jgi:aryl-alcohol dehydrogenase-like predicted oxidoreductase
VRYRQLGNSGLTVSVVGLGANSFGGRLDQQQSSEVVAAAFDAGVTFIDTAELYGIDGSAEIMLGEALRCRPRDKVVLATKFGHVRQAPDNAGGSRRNVRLTVEGSLRRLQTDYIDLYYLHFPDPKTPIAETLRALTELIAEGKVRYIGVCNIAAWQLVEAEWTARTIGLERFIACQERYSLIDRGVEADLIPACLKYGIGFVPFYPLAQGMLTGKYRPGEPPAEGTRLAWRHGVLNDEALAKVARVEAFAHERGLSLLQVAMGGLAAQPGVSSLLTGVTSPEQLLANVAAAEWIPSAEDLAALNALS